MYSLSKFFILTTFAAMAITHAPAQPGAMKYESSACDVDFMLPAGMFDLRHGDGRDTLFEREGDARINVYCGTVPGELPFSEMPSALENLEAIRRVTYRRDGQSWFVLSGYYQPEVPAGEELIFYTKLLNGPGTGTFTAFEIVYPRSRKAEFDGIVTDLEKSFRLTEAR